MDEKGFNPLQVGYKPEFLVGKTYQNIRFNPLQVGYKLILLSDRYLRAFLVSIPYRLATNTSWADISGAAFTVSIPYRLATNLQD